MNGADNVDLGDCRHENPIPAADIADWREQSPGRKRYLESSTLRVNSQGVPGTPSSYCVPFQCLHMARRFMPIP